jgi:hypothetical protein
MSAIATYRTAILALLDDVSKTRYSDNQVDQALRLAMLEYSQSRPNLDVYALDTDGNKVITIPSDFAGTHVFKVELYDANPNLIQEVPFYAYRIAETFYIQTRDVIAAGKVLLLTYSLSHIIDGLDGAAGTSVPEEDETTLQIGAAGYAAQMRATSRAETINMQPSVSGQILKVATMFLTQFRAAIAGTNGAWISDPPNMPEITF